MNKEYNRAYSQRLRDNRRANLLCVECGEPLTLQDQTRCLKCRQRKRQRKSNYVIADERLRLRDAVVEAAKEEKRTLMLCEKQAPWLPPNQHQKAEAALSEAVDALLAFEAAQEAKQAHQDTAP